jgi:hypothetical protein
MPDADLDALLAAVDDPAADTGQIASLAAAVLDADGANTVLPKLAARIPNLGSHSAAHLAMVITAVSDRFPDASGLLGLSTLDRAAILVRDLLGQVRREERSELAAALMRDAQHLPFAVEVIRWLRPQDDHLDRPVLTREECDDAGHVLADRLLDVWCSGDPFTPLSGKVSASLHVCAIYGDGDALRDCLRRRISSDDLSFAFALMRSFLGRAWSLETGVSFVPDLHREGYEALREYVDPSWLFPRLREKFGDEIGEGHSRSRRTADEDERLADAYARFYRADTAKASGDADGGGTDPEMDR